MVESSKPADQPWTLEAAPVTIKAKGKRIPNWGLIVETVTDLQPSPIRSTEPSRTSNWSQWAAPDCESCFPVIGDGPDAREWQKVNGHEEAMLLRLGDPPKPFKQNR